MAQRKDGTARPSSGQGRPADGNRKTTASSTRRPARPAPEKEPVYRANEREGKGDSSLKDEIALICVLLFCVLLILSYFGICGAFGTIVNTVVFGLFGIFGYVFPFLLFAVTLIAIANKHNRSIVKKIIFFAGLVICLASLTEMIFGYNENLGFFEHFTHSALDYTGSSPAYGGLFGAILCCLLCPFTGKVAAVIIMLVLAVIFFLLIAGRAIFTPLTKKGIEHHREHREQERLRREAEAEALGGDGIRSRRERRAREADMSIEEAEKIVREAHEKTEKKKGFIDMLLDEGKETDTAQAGPDGKPAGTLPESCPENADETEFVLSPEDEDIVARELRNKFGGKDNEDPGRVSSLGSRIERGHILGRRGVSRHCMVDDGFETATGRLPDSREEDYTQSDFEEVGETGPDNGRVPDPAQVMKTVQTEDLRSEAEETVPAEETVAGEENAPAAETLSAGQSDDAVPVQNNEPKVIPYVFPPINLLAKNKAAAKSSDRRELKETVEKLQSTFRSFGVGVTVTDATCGPTVTRYELLPDQGVKVKTITALADDVKLALAASEIRIEAPIPGKAAVGIEVPNSETSPVLLRDLIDSPEFKDASSTLTFAVGKDISGRTICFDIASMPHLLVAGATGSGKSVCINSLIMSILYKAKPSEVRMIMIDPKRVELIGYNGIPHLLVPVVTDVKKASGALNWAIAEMDDRYQRFADRGVNNLASYNRVIEEEYYEEGNEGECPDRLPQILIIVDELNDLMMTANSKEVEASICRLTQLARACGIHVVLATQRPSVNVITGTIKANIPSRIAFSVSSLVDSRTIIDQAGAEKLLGKGDMLFYPQGYPKPVRLQGAYVSDREVADVVSFVKSRYKEIKYSEALGRHIENAGNAQTDTAVGEAQGNGDDRDEYYAEAGRLIIKSQKASIGSLQRVYKIGFNRAARIMDSLANDGVVGPEEGTKPRRIIMNMEQFEQFLATGSAQSVEDGQETGEPLE